MFLLNKSNKGNMGFSISYSLLPQGNVPKKGIDLEKLTCNGNKEMFVSNISKEMFVCARNRSLFL